MEVECPVIIFLDWIILLGPETFGDDGLYQYSVITNSDRTSLFVLARDPETFRADYNEEVMLFLILCKLPVAYLQKN